MDLYKQLESLIKTKSSLLENNRTAGRLLDNLEQLKKECTDIWKTPLMTWFSNHDTEHSRSVLIIIGKILESGLKPSLNIYELYVIIAASYVHDIGMQCLNQTGLNPAGEMTPHDFDLVRDRHAEISHELVMKQFSPQMYEREMNLTCTIIEELRTHVALVAKGHAGKHFDEVVKLYRQPKDNDMGLDNPVDGDGTIIRGDLLTALLLIGDELHLHHSRVCSKESNDYRQIKLSKTSHMHWYKHHYVDSVSIERGIINIRIGYPDRMENYVSLIIMELERKLSQQLKLVNQILTDYDQRLVLRLKFEEKKNFRKHPIPDDIILAYCHKLEYFAVPLAIEEYKNVDVVRSSSRRSSSKYRMIGFDLDGTLLRGEGYKYSWKLVWDHIKLDNAKWFESKRKFELSSRTYQDYKEWCNRDCETMKSHEIKKEDFNEITSNIRATKNLIETLQKLKDEGFVLAIISGGIDIFIDMVIPHAKNYFDYICINKLVFDAQGKLTDIKPTPFDFVGKAAALTAICKKHGILLENSVFIGEGRNDQDAAKIAGLSIAYPYHEELDSIWKEFENTDDLSKILNIVLKEN